MWEHESGGSAGVSKGLSAVPSSMISAYVGKEVIAQYSLIIQEYAPAIKGFPLLNASNGLYKYIIHVLEKSQK